MQRSRCPLIRRKERIKFETAGGCRQGSCRRSSSCCALAGLRVEEHGQLGSSFALSESNARGSRGGPLTASDGPPAGSRSAIPRTCGDSRSEPAEVEETPPDRHRPDRVLAIGPQEVLPGRVEPQGVPVGPERRSIEVLEPELERAQRRAELRGAAGDAEVVLETLADHLLRPAGEAEAARIAAPRGRGPGRATSASTIAPSVSASVRRRRRALPVSARAGERSSRRSP